VLLGLRWVLIFKERFPFYPFAGCGGMRTNFWTYVGDGIGCDAALCGSRASFSGFPFRADRGPFSVQVLVVAQAPRWRLLRQAFGELSLSLDAGPCSSAPGAHWAKIRVDSVAWAGFCCSKHALEATGSSEQVSRGAARGRRLYVRFAGPCCSRPHPPPERIGSGAAAVLRRCKWF